MRTAAEVAARSLCLRKKCGTIIVKDGCIVGEGYNAPPLDREEHRMCGKTLGPGKPKYDRTCCLHAEWRAILDGLARFPKSLAGGATLYFTRVDDNGRIQKSGEPFCTVCSRLALDAGIAAFVLWQEAGLRAYPTDVYNQESYAYVHPEPAPPAVQAQVVVGMLKDAEGRIFLQRRVDAAIPGAHGKWEFPGGKVDFGESPECAVVREIREEIGCEAEALRMLPAVQSRIWTTRNSGQMHVLVLCHEMRLLSGVPAPRETKLSEVGWFWPDEIKTLDVLPGILEFVEIGERIA